MNCCAIPTSQNSNDEKADRRLDWEGISRSVKNRTFFPQPPWARRMRRAGGHGWPPRACAEQGLRSAMDSRRSGKCPPNPASGAREPYRFSARYQGITDDVVRQQVSVAGSALGGAIGGPLAELQYPRPAMDVRFAGAPQKSPLEIGGNPLLRRAPLRQGFPPPPHPPRTPYGDA